MLANNQIDEIRALATQNNFSEANLKNTITYRDHAQTQIEVANFLKTQPRFRDYLVYVQVMSYLAHKEGHSKTSIGKFLKRNHATIINSCKMIENGFFSNDKTVMHAYNNTLKQLEDYVGTIPKDTKSKPNTKPELDPIWYEAKNLITRGSSKG